MEWRCFKNYNFILRAYGPLSYLFSSFLAYQVPYSPNMKLTITVNLQTSCFLVCLHFKKIVFLWLPFSFSLQRSVSKSDGYPSLQFLHENGRSAMLRHKTISVNSVNIMLLQDLYNWLEVEFNPLSLCNKMEAKLKVAKINLANLVFSGCPWYL